MRRLKRSLFWTAAGIVLIVVTATIEKFIEADEKYRQRMNRTT